jgi:hypothetical protein
VTLQDDLSKQLGVVSEPLLLVKTRTGIREGSNKSGRLSSPMQVSPANNGRTDEELSQAQHTIQQSLRCNCSEGCHTGCQLRMRDHGTPLQGHVLDCKDLHRWMCHCDCAFVFAVTFCELIVEMMPTVKCEPCRVLWQDHPLSQAAKSSMLPLRSSGERVLLTRVH